MGRHRASKFSFPLPGRRSHTKVDRADRNDELSPIASVSSIPSVRDRPTRYEEASSYSKAQRVLGTAGPPFLPASRQAVPPPSPGYMTITVSEPGSELDDKASSYAFDPPRRPNLSNRASSNILPANMPYTSDSRRGSNASSVSRQLNARPSNSTMRSHYDAQASPLAISQQTSDSAVRDMALRKGQPQIGTYKQDYHAPSPLAHEVLEESKKEQRKSRPPRLDLAKLFPKPKGNGGQEPILLSPTKVVNSPSAMSTASDYFPRPMTREPTPTRGGAKLVKPKKLHHSSSAQPVLPVSPARMYKRDTYDNAKINVRRPPRGIKHWFEGLEEDSDDIDEDDELTPMHAPVPVAPERKIPLAIPGMPKHQASHTLPSSKNPGYMYADTAMAQSQVSVQSQSSRGTAKTRESAFFRTNLQESSVLSFSSSEDEDERPVPIKGKVSVRDSMYLADHGDIVIGQAQALEVRPSNHRRPSVGKLSMLSTSTGAATIEVMYTPEPYATQHFPRHYSSSRRSSHAKHPSVILEDDGAYARPKTANAPSSPSTRSNRTTKSEPQTPGAQKFMAVTAEEEALLEALRKKRAAMAKQSWAEGYETAIKQEEVRQKTPPETRDRTYRTSAFLSGATPSSSPVRVVETKKSSRKSLAPTPTPLLMPHSRGRSTATLSVVTGPGMRRDSSSREPELTHQRASSPNSVAHQLSPAPEFSPLDPFPPSSPVPTTSVASPTTTNHPSPLPSPITPGLRHGEADVNVKVATSEPSCDGDDDVPAIPETGIIDAPTGSIKTEESRNPLQRRRTASSGADVPFVLPFKAAPQELDPVSEASSRAPSINDSIVTTSTQQPKFPPRVSSSRQSAFSISTFGVSKSRHGSMTSMRTASPGGGNRKTTSRMSSMSSIKRESVGVGSVGSRCSVSEDVLAAWGSLGGLRDYERRY